MLDVIFRIATIVTSMSLNAQLSPQDTPTENHIFVSSVIILVACLEAVCISWTCVLVQRICNIKIRFHANILFTPLTTALQKQEEQRSGDFNGDNKQMFVPTAATALDEETANLHRDPGARVEGSGVGYLDVDSANDNELLFEDFDIIIEETRDVYRDIYLLGIGTFCIFYSTDTVSSVPSFCFVMGLFVTSIRDVYHVIRSLTRGGSVNTIGFVRLLTLVAYCFILFSLMTMTFVFLQRFEVSDKDYSYLNVIMSVVLPTLSPCMLHYISPKQDPLRTIRECSPFVATMALWYIASFLSLRGLMTTVMKAESVSGATEIDVQFDMNSFHVHTAVDNFYNIPWIILIPLLKIPAMSIIIAAIINRRNLEIICPILLVLTIRELIHSPHDSGHLLQNKLLTISLILVCLASISFMGKELVSRKQLIP